MLAAVRRDVRAALDRDPAACSALTVVLCYPGVHAIWGHRVSGWLWRRHACLLARLSAELTRIFTGVEIHPAATLGPGLFIDHATGVVIGETTEIGADVTIYQGVTLGGTSTETGKRHPTVGDRVIMGQRKSWAPLRSVTTAGSALTPSWSSRSRADRWSSASPGRSSRAVSPGRPPPCRGTTTRCCRIWSAPASSR